MMKIYNDIDDELWFEVFIAYYKIKDKSNDNNSIYNFRKACEQILINNKKVNFTISKMVSEEITKIDSIRNVLYLIFHFC